jgi:cell division protein FtsZ
MGKAMMGTGEAEGEERARVAAEAAISNPLLDEVSMKGARGVLINITGGPDMTLFEVDEAANRIGDEVDPEANIIFGSTMDPALEGKIRVSVVATGIDAEVESKPRPIPKVYSNQPHSEASSIERAAEFDGAPVAKVGIDAMEPPLELSTEAPPRTEVGTPVTPSRPKSPIELPQSTSPRIMEKPAMASIRAEDPSLDDAALEVEAMPEIVSTEGAGEAFIPPPAIDPRHAKEPSKRPDPFREADLINGGTPAPRRRKGLSLLDRMKRVGKSAKKEIEPTISDNNQAEFATEQRLKNDPPKIKLNRSKSPEQESLPASRQPRLDDMSPVAGPQSAQSEEDLLDIPAFLRRQAN